jgi:anti-sigma28 factor (negative regulator of flagellin synthesis)
MISQLNSATVRSAYGNTLENKEIPQKSSFSVSKQGDISKVDQIKSSLESGEYKVNLQTLSQKIAQELV